jgi:hypothetical protein
MSLFLYTRASELELPILCYEHVTLPYRFIGDLSIIKILRAWASSRADPVAEHIIYRPDPYWTFTERLAGIVPYLIGFLGFGTINLVDLNNDGLRQIALANQSSPFSRPDQLLYPILCMR